MAGDYAKITDKLNTLLSIIPAVDQIKKDMPTKQELSVIMQHLQSTDAKIDTIESTIANQQKTIQQLQNTIRKRNLIFNGLKEEEINTDELSKQIITLVNKYINLNISQHDIEEVYRLGKKTENIRPIRVSFNNLNTKKIIYDNRKCFKGSNIFVNLDLCKEDYIKRRELWNLAKEKAKGQELKNTKLANINVNGRNDKRKVRLSSDDSPTNVKQLPKLIKHSTPVLTYDKDGDSGPGDSSNQPTIAPFLP